jgi:pyrophosphatase PpaX
MKTYTTFLFDWDGTLCDSNEHVIACFKAAFRDVLNVDLPEATITATFGIPLDPAIRGLDPLHADDLLKAYRRHSDAYGDSLLKMIPHADLVLKDLTERGCTCALVTSKKEVNARHQLEIFDLLRYMSLIVGPEATPIHKPEPDPVLYALAALRARPEETLMIGDSAYDILCGNRAGVDTAGVDFTVTDLQALQQAGPTYMISDLTDLLSLARG